VTDATEVSTTESTPLRIVYTPGLSAADWSTRHARGEVPSRWPYGFELFADRGFEVDPDGQSPVRPSATLGFDERVASQVASSSGTRVCGAIWIADELSTPSRRPRRILARRRTVQALRRMNQVLAYSTASAQALPDLLSIDPRRVRFIPLGIDTAFYSRAATENDGQLVLSVGNDRSRDITTLYEACAYVHSHLPTVAFKIQTSDPRPAPDCVTTVDRLRDHAELKNLYAACSLVAVATRPNLYTSGSTVALEAQAVGRPVVMSRTPGMESYVQHDETGLLVKAGDYRGMGDAMLKLLRDPARARAMGANGAERVLARHSTASMTAAIADAIQDALDD
jgi:glycosyltransferase involved in cell wall biosynthesis